MEPSLKQKPSHSTNHRTIKRVQTLEPTKGKRSKFKDNRETGKCAITPRNQTGNTQVSRIDISSGFQYMSSLSDKTPCQ